MGFGNCTDIGNQTDRATLNGNNTIDIGGEYLVPGEIPVGEIIGFYNIKTGK